MFLLQISIQVKELLFWLHLEPSVNPAFVRALRNGMHSVLIRPNVLSEGDIIFIVISGNQTENRLFLHHSQGEKKALRAADVQAAANTSALLLMGRAADAGGQRPGRMHEWASERCIPSPQDPTQTL